jgi:hypothetical protein
MPDQDKPFSQKIIDAGEDFQVDAMEDFDARVASGEFANKTPQQIRDIYLDEAIHAEDDADAAASIRATEEQEQRELDRELDGGDDD